MIYFPLMGLFVLVGLGWVGLVVFFWMQFGPGSGLAAQSQLMQCVVAGLDGREAYTLLGTGELHDPRSQQVAHTGH